MKVKVEVTITEKKEIEIPDYVRKTNSAIEEFLVDDYYGFEHGLEGDTSFQFESITILRKKP